MSTKNYINKLRGALKGFGVGLALAVCAMALAGTAQAAQIDLSSATGVFLANTAAGGDGTLAGTDWANANSYYDGGGLGFSVLTDGTSDTKWLGCGTESFGTSYPGPGGNGAGFYFTLAAPAAMQSIQLFTEDSAPPRSPATMTIEGSNAGDPMLGASWTLLYSGPAGLEGIGSFSAGAIVNFVNATAYTSYRVLFPTVIGNPFQGAQLADIVATDTPTFSTACDITAFGANVVGSGAIITTTGPGTGTIAWTVPPGTDVENLAPDYTVSAFATGDPTYPSGTSRNFTSSQDYTITAQDGISTNTYTVTVTVGVAPANDNFVDAIDLTPASGGTKTGTGNADATLEAGEPNPANYHTVWFKWTPAEDGYFTISTLGSTALGGGEWDAVLAIHTGSSVDALTTVAGPQDYNYEETITGLQVTAGTTYYIQLAGYGDGVAENILLTWSFIPLTSCDILSFGPGAVITGTDIAWTVPYDADVANLMASITLSSPGATVSPASGDPVDYSGGSVPFIVMAGDGITSNTYTVTVTKAAPALYIGMEQYNVGGPGATPSPIDCTSGDLLEMAGVAAANEPITGWRDGSFDSSGGAYYSDNTTQVLTYTLDLVSSPTGYNIQEVRMFSGWDVYRSGQSYDVSYSLVGTPDTFVALGSVVTGDRNGAVMTRTYNSGGTDILTGVAKIRFNIKPTGEAFPPGEGYGTFYREIDVLGTPTPIDPKACDILSFGPGAVITGTAIAWSVPFEANVAALAPTYTISPGATNDVDYPPGTERNFTSPKDYTITSQDGTTTKTYTVTVTVLPYVAEKLSNGSFETGKDIPLNWNGGMGGYVAVDLSSGPSNTDLPGWFGSFTQWYDINYAEWHSAQDGERWINLLGATGVQVISQSFDVVAGTRYIVSYYETRRGGGGYMDATLSVSSGTVAGADGAPVAVAAGPAASIVQTTAANADWTLHRFTFIPDTTTTATLTFGNIYDAERGGDNDGVMLDMVSAQVTTFTVTYDGNGNTTGVVPVDASPYTNSATVTVLGNTGTLAKTGSTFEGWNTQADGLGTSYAADATLPITADTTLYAKWAVIPVYNTLTYNGNGSDNDLDAPVDGSSPYLSGTTVTVLGQGALVKVGYTFDGWNTQADGLGTSYAPADTFSITANTTLYAKWAVGVVNHTLTYIEGVGGTITGTKVQVVPDLGDGTEVTAMPDLGYHFVKWSDDVMTASRTDTAVTADITVTASFAVNPPDAVFTSDKISGVRPLVVTFTDTSTGIGITEVSWNFGDSSPVVNKLAGESVTHTFAVEGTWTVTQTVTSPGGIDTSTSNITVAAPGQPTIVSTKSGSNMVLTGAGGPHDASYKFIVQTSPDLKTGPWTDESTMGNFNADGTYSYTIAINPADTKKFYRIKMP